MRCMMGARKVNMIRLSSVDNAHSKVLSANSVLILCRRVIQSIAERCGGSSASVPMQANDSSHLSRHPNFHSSFPSYSGSSLSILPTGVGIIL